MFSKDRAVLSDSLRQATSPVTFILKARWIISSMLIAGVVLALAHPAIYPPRFEGNDYVRMAEGKYSTAYFYYAGRIFHPWLAGIVAKTIHISIAESFRMLAVIAVPILLLCATYPVRRLRFLEQLGIGVALFVNPIMIFTVQNYYFQDLVFLVLVALFCLVVSRYGSIASPILFVLALTREVAVVMAASAFLVSVIRKRYVFALVVILCYFPATIISQRLVRDAQPNKHGLGVITTDILKVPFNVAHNLLGIVIWTDTNVDTNDCATRLRWDVSTLGLGHIAEIGVCAWRPSLPLATIELFLTSFGVLPVILLMWFRQTTWSFTSFRSFTHASDAWLISASYGLCMLALAPLIGTWVSRYIVYAAPLFWAASVGLVDAVKCGLNRNWARGAVLLGSTAVAWLPTIGQALIPDSAWVTLAIDITVGAAYYVLWVALEPGLRRNYKSGPDVAAHCAW